MHRKLNLWLPLGDIAGLLLSWLVSFTILWIGGTEQWRSGIVAWWSDLGSSRIGVFAGLLALMVVLFGLRGHYTRRQPSSDEILDIFKVFLLVAAVDAFFAYLTKSYVPRSWFITGWLFALFLVPAARVATKWLLLRAGRWRLETIIIGAGKNAREAAQALQSEPLMGIDVLAFVPPPGESVSRSGILVGEEEIPVVSYREGLADLLNQADSPQIVVALDAENLLQHSGLIQELSVHDAELSIIPPLRGLPLYGMEMTHFFSHEVLMLKVRNNLERPVHQLVKRTFDLIVAAFLLVSLSPLFVYLIVRIRETGPEAIFGHKRVGRDGKVFYCLKFRTMVPDAGAVLDDLLARDADARQEWERDFKLKNDPRITQIGAFLRSTSLDELPQLWNVLKGEMSLVGPRPVIEEELVRYGDQVRYYLEARPGITGLWQVSGRNDTGYEDRVALDTWYVRNWSLWYDVVILLRTIAVVVRREGAY